MIVTDRADTIFSGTYGPFDNLGQAVRWLSPRVGAMRIEEDKTPLAGCVRSWSVWSGEVRTRYEIRDTTE